MLDPYHIDFLISVGVCNWTSPQGYAHIIHNETHIDFTDLPDSICGTKKSYPKPQIKPDTIEPTVASIISSIDEMFAWTDNQTRSRKVTTPFEFHDGLKYALRILAQRYGLIGTEEYYVDNRGDGQFGYIDVVWCDKNNIPVVAIEIDSQYQDKSLFKLRRNEAPLKFWIFYNYVYDNLYITDVIIIPKLRVREPAATREQDGVVAPDAATWLPPTQRRLTDRGYKSICAFGYLGMWICALCVKMSPFDGRRLFCGFGVVA